MKNGFSLHMILTSADWLQPFGSQLPSVIIFRLRNMRPERVNRYLQEIVTQHRDILEKGAIIIVDDRNIRVRILPLG